MFTGLLRTCISTTGTVFSRNTGYEEPGGGIGGRELENVSILLYIHNFRRLRPPPLAVLSAVYLKR